MGRLDRVSSPLSKRRESHHGPNLYKQLIRLAAGAMSARLLRRGLATAAAQAPAPQPALRFLVIDGYVKQGREVLEAGGATTAGQLYADMLVRAAARVTDVPATYDLAFSADPEFELPDLAGYHAIGWSGSSLAVHKADDPPVVQMTDLARRGFAAGIPQFGSCFGLQLATATAGGVVRKNPRGKELGVARKIALTAAGRAHPMYDGKPAVFGAFSSHNDQVSHLAATGSLLLSQNFFTPVQSAAISYLKGDFWGLQYHPEYDLHEIARLLHCRREVNTKLGFFQHVKKADAFIDELETLAADPTRLDIAWKFGYDEDVLNEDVRTCEVRNFVKHLVMPYYFRRQRIAPF